MGACCAGIYIGNIVSVIVLHPSMGSMNRGLTMNTATKFCIKTVHMQDPMFNRLDEEFLRSLSYSILSTPEAYEELTPETFLFAPHLEWPNYIQALQVATPSLCIGNSLREYLGSFQKTLKTSKELEFEETLQDYVEWSETVDMPVFDRALWYMSTSIYWRKEREELEATNGEVQKAGGTGA